ncbi:MAG: hypothetical protein ABW008_05230 [Acidimicrobiales bacterium]
MAALFLYLTRIIRPTAKMAFGVAAGIGGLILVTLIWLYISILRVLALLARNR